MCLYVIYTGYTGCSYERCYVWASSEQRAIELFKEKHPRRIFKSIGLLFCRANPEFVTELSDEGFDISSD